MRSVNCKIAILVGFAVFMSLVWSELAVVRADGRPTTKWEYKVVTLGGYESQHEKEWADKLARLGEDGWEVVGLMLSTHGGNSSACIATVKRPK